MAADQRTEDERFRQTGPPHAANPTAGVTPASASITDFGEQRVVGVVQERHQLEQAIAQLQQVGVSLQTLAIVIRETEAPPTAGPSGKAGQAIAEVFRLTSGQSIIDLPEIGPTRFMGPDATTLASMIKRYPATTATEVLENLGIAHDSAHLYSRHLMAGDFLVTLRGQAPALDQIASLLGQHGLHHGGIYTVRPA